MSSSSAKARLSAGNVGEMREKAQLDLAVVGRDELASFGRDEGAPDLAPFLGADRNVLQVRLRRRQAPGRGRSERVGRVDAAGSRIDEARQGVGVGRLELGDLPPFEHARRQLMAFGGEVFEHARGGRPRAGRGLLAAGQAHLAEQNVAKLFRRAGVEGRADDFVDLGLERRPCAGKTRPSCATGCCGRSRSRAAPCAPEPRRADARAARRPWSFARRRGAAAKRAADAKRCPLSPLRIRRPFRSARARAQGNCGPSPRPRSREWACGRESVRRACRCCGRRRSRPRRACKRSSMASSIGATRTPRIASTCMSNLMSWPILSTPGDSSSGFRSAIASASGDLVGREAAALEEIVGAGLVADRDVAGLSRLDRQRKADELALQRVGRRRLGVDRDDALILARGRSMRQARPRFARSCRRCDRSERALRYARAAARSAGVVPCGAVLGSRGAGAGTAAAGGAPSAGASPSRSNSATPLPPGHAAGPTKRGSGSIERHVDAAYLG